MQYKAILALENASVFQGSSFSNHSNCEGEVVFNTSMTGYQEILTDPSYAHQIVTLTYPHIGNVGTNDQDVESHQVFASGLIIRDLTIATSNWRSEMSLVDYCLKHKLVTITDIDTRRLTKMIRNEGALRGVIQIGENINTDLAIEKARAIPDMNGQDLASKVTTSKSYQWREGLWHYPNGHRVFQESELPQKVFVYDFGVKRNILRHLVEQGCDLTVVPATTPAKDILAEKPDAVVLSNGPGDPAACDYAIENAKQLIMSDIPLLGICLGFQILMLALGAKTLKMKFGHHGANHPVRDCETGRVFITSQNHGFAVDEKSLTKNIIVTHRSLFDQTLQGIKHRDKPIIGFQGHPEASPGPHDIDLLMTTFKQLMLEKNAKT